MGQKYGVRWRRFDVLDVSEEFADRILSFVGSGSGLLFGASTVDCTFACRVAHAAFSLRVGKKSLR